MDAVIQQASALKGELSVPPDKAIFHRAILVSALAEGQTQIAPTPSADDCRRSLDVIRALGVSVVCRDDAFKIQGKALRLEAPAGPIACGESGTTLRLAAGLLAGQPFTTQLTASASLSRRPMRRIIEPLSLMGAEITARPGISGEAHAPLTIHGKRPLKAISYPMPVASAQVKSAILLAGLFTDGKTQVIERIATRDHTEQILRCFGVDVKAQGKTITLTPASLRSPASLVIPGDISSASFFIVAACCVPGSHLVLEGVGLNPTRTGILRVLKRMGGAIDITQEDGSWEKRGRLSVSASSLKAVTVSPEEVPAVIDELPILMVAATRAKGVSRFEGIGELRVKETDRIQSMLEGLTRLGADVRLPAPDVVEIAGGTLTGSSVDSAGDHRTAMSLSIAGLFAKGTTTIRQAGCVAKSFPDFFARLERVVGSTTVKTVDK